MITHPNRFVNGLAIFEKINMFYIDINMIIVYNSFKYYIMCI